MYYNVIIVLQLHKYGMQLKHNVQLVHNIVQDLIVKLIMVQQHVLYVILNIYGMELNVNHVIQVVLVHYQIVKHVHGIHHQVHLYVKHVKLVMLKLMMDLNVTNAQIIVLLVN